MTNPFIEYKAVLEDLWKIRTLDPGEVDGRYYNQETIKIATLMYWIKLAADPAAIFPSWEDVNNYIELFWEAQMPKGVIGTERYKIIENALLKQLAEAVGGGGGGGGGTSDFDQLTNRPQYGGSTMSSLTNVKPITKTTITLSANPIITLPATNLSETTLLVSFNRTLLDNTSLLLPNITGEGLIIVQVDPGNAAYNLNFMTASGGTVLYTAALNKQPSLVLLGRNADGTVSGIAVNNTDLSNYITATEIAAKYATLYHKVIGEQTNVPFDQIPVQNWAEGLNMSSIAANTDTSNVATNDICSWKDSSNNTYTLRMAIYGPPGNERVLINRFKGGTQDLPILGYSGSISNQPWIGNCTQCKVLNATLYTKMTSIVSFTSPRTYESDYWVDVQQAYEFAAHLDLDLVAANQGTADCKIAAPLFKGTIAPQNQYITAGDVASIYGPVANRVVNVPSGNWLIIATVDPGGNTNGKFDTFHFDLTLADAYTFQFDGRIYVSNEITTSDPYDDNIQYKTYGRLNSSSTSMPFLKIWRANSGTTYGRFYTLAVDATAYDFTGGCKAIISNIGCANGGIGLNMPTITTPMTIVNTEPNGEPQGFTASFINLV